jgi:hypothetical protein
LIKGEYKNAAFEAKYAKNPRMFIVGKSMVVPVVDFLRKLSMGCG